LRILDQTLSQERVTIFVNDTTELYKQPFPALRYNPNLQLSHDSPRNQAKHRSSFQFTNVK
jgi:hypothetical protein